MESLKASIDEVGGIRIIYEINVKNKTVEIKAIRSRGDVYKR
jgi:mRNA-degrading endonuclease RelE of RelBE toxin-antitoxin system